MGGETPEPKTRHGSKSRGPLARRPGWRRLAISRRLIACGLALLAYFDLLELELHSRSTPGDRHRNRDAAALALSYLRNNRLDSLGVDRDHLE